MSVTLADAAEMVRWWYLACGAASPDAYFNYTSSKRVASLLAEGTS